MTSTFSIITLIVVVAYTGLCLWLKDIVNLKEVAMFLLGAYGMKKGMASQEPKKEQPAGSAK